MLRGMTVAGLVKAGTILLFIALGIALTLWLLDRLLTLALLILIAIVLTTGIDPLVEWVHTRIPKLPRGLIILAVLLFGVLVVLGIITFIGFIAVREAIDFVQNTWPVWREDLLAWARGLADRYAFIPDPDTIYERLQGQGGRIASYAWATTSAVFGAVGAVFSAVTVLILTFFFTHFKDGITRTFARLIPPQYRERTLEVSHRAAVKMGGWLRGQLLLALIMTVIILIGMWLLGVPYAALIAIIGGIGELVPMIGAYVAAIPAVLIVLALGAPLWQVIAVILFFLILSQVENYVFSPKIMEHEVSLSPVTTILALLIGGSLLGIVGALLAIPITAAGRVVMLEVVFPAIERRGHSRDRAV
jgi:predicted PurR-regulated permease PerM